MIHLEDVSKVYRTSKGEVRALDGVTLQIAQGEFAAVRGPSGCGKSTLLAMIGGLAQPTSGRVVVEGHDLGRMPSSKRAAHRAEHIGFVFQMFHLLPYLNVVDNVLLAAPAPTQSTPATRAAAEELLEKFGLQKRRLHKPAELSVGQRQRVAMARALLNRPSLLLADEPTGNLDPENATAVLDLLAAFHQEGGTVLLVTHEENAARYAQRTILLREGRLETESAVRINGG